MAEVESVAQDEVAQELQTRVEAFNKEMQVLLGKYELGLNAVPFITDGWGKVRVNGLETLVPPGIVSARPNLVDMKGKTAVKDSGLSEA